MDARRDIVPRRDVTGATAIRRRSRKLADALAVVFLRRAALCSLSEHKGSVSSTPGWLVVRGASRAAVSRAPRAYSHQTNKKSASLHQSFCQPRRVRFVPGEHGR